MIYLQSKSIQNINYALDQCPEQSLNSALKINNMQLQLLLFLLLTDNASLMDYLGDNRLHARTRHYNLFQQIKL